MVGVEETEEMTWAAAGKAGLVALEKAAFERWVAVESANAVVDDTPRVMGEHLMVYCWVLRGGRWMDAGAVASPLLRVLSLWAM